MPTISAKLQSLISERIISGHYLPGSRLDERALAAEYKVSRTPIREALRQLAVRGLTEILPMRGVLVRQVGVKELSEILHADCELEALCARLAAESMSAMEKSELEYIHQRSKEYVDSGDLDHYLATNRELHRLILEGAHNEVLRQIVGDIRERLSPYRQYHPAETDRLESSFSSHDAIVRAIVGGDGEQAYRAMRAHNAHLGNAALRAIRQAREPAPKPDIPAPAPPKKAPARKRAAVRQVAKAAPAKKARRAGAAR